MTAKNLKNYLLVTILISLNYYAFGQGSVPFGIHYQAVARDNFGKELADKVIDVRFSIISENPLGTLAYQELHSKVKTSKYGVFTLIIGHGTPTGGIFGELSQINWAQSFHYLKVEVKFDNVFIDMGTMQFLAVPYALYAQKSLEPGPQGPKGEQGDPATDNQTLSFNGNNLSISGGNTVNLSTLNVPHSLSIAGNNLSIMGGNEVALPDQIQDLSLGVDNKLTLSKSALPGIDFTRFLEDKQQLSFNSTNNSLSITNGTAAADLSKFDQTLAFNTTNNNLSISGGSSPVDLSVLKNDADADPLNELQTISYNKNSGDLTISSRNTVNLVNSIGFKAKKSISETGLTAGTTYPFINSEVEFNDGPCYVISSGSITALMAGIYTFYITYKADGLGSGRVLSLLKNGAVWEILGPDISSGTEVIKWVTMKLNQGDIVSLTINTGMSTFSGTGSFLGYKVN